MSTEAADLGAAQTLVARALSVPVDRIGPETKMYDLSVWDSLGQLSVVLAVEEARQVRIAEDALFRSLTSVRGIASYLAGTAP